MDVVASQTLILALATLVIVMIGVIWYGAGYVRSAHRRISRLEEHFQVLAKRLHQRSHANPEQEQTAYQRAQSMIADAKPLDEVVKRCGISMAEAELLKLMYAQVQNTPNQDQD